MNRLEHIARLEAEISALESLRGTDREPPALDAQIGQHLRTLAWHRVRLDETHHNVGRASLYDRSGKSKRARRAVERDFPLVGLAVSV
jgi:transcription termination factor NusB